MQTSKRVFNQPAWVLHHRPFRDTSRILDILSLEHGRLSLVARGARSAKSKLRGYLRPFTPLQLSWVIRSDLGTLTGAEMNGAPISLTGDALLSGYYVNELLLNLLHRHDPQPEIHAAYASTVAALAGSSDIAASLRHFEIELLRLGKLEEAHEKVVLRFKVGAISQLEVLESERNLLGSQQTKLGQTARLHQDVINLYVALGRGW